MNSPNPKPGLRPLKVKRLAPKYKDATDATDIYESGYYPESDGEPLAENTLHLNWIITIHNALTILFKDREDVFVAGDLLWYPIHGNRQARRAPDAMVVFGRPKRHMEKVGAYLQWEEEGIAPQVVFEVCSPSDTKAVLRDKFSFYDRYGVEEYYLSDPEASRTRGWIRKNGHLVEIGSMTSWTSPLLGIRFQSGGKFHMLWPDGKPFLDPKAIFEDWERERKALVADKEQALADKEQALALFRQEQREKDAAIEELQRMKELMRSMGLDSSSSSS